MCKNMADASNQNIIIKINNSEFNLLLTKTNLKLKINKFFDFRKIFKLLNYFYTKYDFQINHVSIDYVNCELELENSIDFLSQEFLTNYEKFLLVLEKIIESDKYFYSGNNLNNAEIIKIDIFFKNKLKEDLKILNENYNDEFYILYNI